MGEKCGTWPALSTQTTVVLERYRVRCPDCGVKAEKVEQLPSQAPFSKRFEEAVGQACESAAARQVAKRLGLVEHGAGHGPALSGTVGGREAEAGPATDGRG